MDKYTKFILTIIAVGVIGLNFHLFKFDLVSEAKAKHYDMYDAEYPGHQVAHVTIDNWPRSITCK